MLSQSDILDALALLGTLLDERGLRFDGIAIGGANLLVSGVISRPTIDIDIVAQLDTHRSLLAATPLPSEIEDAVGVVSQLRGIAPTWFNSMAGSEIQFGLPQGCIERLRPQHFGGLVIWWVDRIDLIAFKLPAAVDHIDYQVNKHLGDLLLLKPTPAELAHAIAWFEQITAPTSASWPDLPRILERLSDDE